MDELVLNERSRRKAVAGTAFLLGLGGLLTVPGTLQALKGNAEAWLSLFPFAMAGLLLFMGCVGLAGRGMPDGLVLTAQGLRITRGRESFLLPASSLRAFVLTPMKPFRKGVPLKNLRRFNVQVDPAAMAGLPRYIARLRSKERPDELCLVFVGEKAVPETRIEAARQFVLRHALAEWDDRTHPA